MMAGSRSNPRRRLTPATTWLIRAFAPGCPTLLRYWTGQKVDRASELLTIFYDLPDQPAFVRALELERSASALRQVRIGQTVIHDLTAEVSGKHRTLRVEALLGTDDWGKAPE